MEKVGKTIVTNPLFKQIAEGCWQELNGTDEMESLETMANYSEFIPKAVQRLSQFQNYSLSLEEARTLWRGMLKAGLVFCERTEKMEWKKILVNPRKFIWETTQKPRYKWLPAAPKKVPSFPKPSLATKEESFEANVEEFFKNELAEVQSRIQILEAKKEGLEEEKSRLEELLSRLQKILDAYDGLIRCEREKIVLLQPRQEDKQ